MGRTVCLFSETDFLELMLFELLFWLCEQVVLVRVDPGSSIGFDLERALGGLFSFPCKYGLCSRGALLKLSSKSASLPELGEFDLVSFIEMEYN